jgi:hypothetical protein
LNEIKTIVAYLIRRYDIKVAPNSEKRPKSSTLTSRGFPNLTLASWQKREK